jgi:plastocyanin
MLKIKTHTTMKKKLLTISLIFGVTASLSAATFNVSMTNDMFSPQTLNISTGDMVIWTNNGTNAHTSTSGSGCSPNGTWDSGTKTQGQTFSYTFSSAGSFPYFCTFHCGSGMTGTITVTGTTGIFNAKASSLNIFPNPFTDLVTLSVNQGNNNVSMIKIMDALGKEIKNTEVSVGQSSYSLDLSDLQPGMYFCNLYSSEGIIETRKIFRTR